MSAVTLTQVSNKKVRHMLLEPTNLMNEKRNNRLVPEVVYYAIGDSSTYSGTTITQGIYIYNNGELRQVGSIPADVSGYASSSHTHGNITNGGSLNSSGVAIASGDCVVVTDNSDSSKVAKTSATFDGATTTKALTKKGTFETMKDARVSNTTVTIDGTQYNTLAFDHDENSNTAAIKMATTDFTPSFVEVNSQIAATVGSYSFEFLSQSEYDAIPNKDGETFYFITE